MRLHEPPVHDAHWEGTELGEDHTHRYVWF